MSALEIMFGLTLVYAVYVHWTVYVTRTAVQIVAGRLAKVECYLREESS